MEQNEKPLEEGAGFYDFSQLMGETEEQDRDFVVPEDPTVEEVETEEATTETTTEPSEEEQEEEEVISKETPTEKTSTSNYASLAKKYIEIGTWQDAEVEIEGETVVLSELEDIDEETFLNLVQAQDAEKNKELESKFINKEDLDEISLKIIEISKNGGDIKEVLKAKETYIDNLNTYDLDNEFHQEQLVRQKYKLQNPNFSEKQIDTLVKVHKDDLDLDTVAKEFADDLKKSYHMMLDKEKEKATSLKLQQEEERKVLRKDLKSSLLELGISDGAARPLIDAVTKQTENGFLIDQQFQDMKKDPKELAEFLLWKNDRESYKKIVSKKETDNSKKDTLVKLNLLRGKHTSTKNKAEKTEASDRATELAARLSFM